MCDNNSRDDLADIRNARVDRNLPQAEKLPTFIRRIKDPYHYKCGGIAITAQFDKDGPPLANCVGSMMTL